MLKNKSAKLLLWVGIAGISMFFAGLTSAYIVRKAEGNWIVFQLPDWFLLSTIVVVCSSSYLIIAKRIIKQNKDYNKEKDLLTKIQMFELYKFAKNWIKKYKLSE